VEVVIVVIVVIVVRVVRVVRVIKVVNEGNLHYLTDGSAEIYLNPDYQYIYKLGTRFEFFSKD